MSLAKDIVYCVQLGLVPLTNSNKKYTYSDFEWVNVETH